MLSAYMVYFEGSTPHIIGYSGSFKETISETALKNITPELLRLLNTLYAKFDMNIEEIINSNQMRFSIMQIKESIHKY